MMKEDVCAKQLICGNSEFNVAELNSFVKKVKFGKCGSSYAVVAIMGPQSGGKSTLMNHLFDTGFQEMKIESGRSQTTKGIWIAKCVGIEPCTIALDLEGSDSSERGEDDTTFEKQIALFGLAVSDILLINMWYNDIGREQAASKPLLKTIFQALMRLSSDPPKKTTLLFVVRDKPSKAPFELLENRLKEDTEKMWDAVSKPQAHKKSPLTVFFNVQVVALSSYLEKEETFKEEVAQLRQRFVNSISPGGLVGDRKSVVPASGFSLSTQEMWRVIKLNKDLDLPAHKVMVATVLCEEISTDIFKQLIEDKGWLALKEAAQTGLIPDFGKRLSSILDTYLSEYDEKALYYHEGVRNSKRQILESKALDSVYITYITMLRHLRSKALEEFKVKLEWSLKEGSGLFNSSAQNCIQSSMLDFDQGCKDAAIQQANWDFSSILKEHRRDIEAHVASVHCAKLLELKVNYEKQLLESLTKQVEAFLKGGGDDTWASIRKLLNRETNDVLSKFSNAIVRFEVDKESLIKLKQNFRDYARQVVEEKAKYEADHSVLIHMKSRFSAVFNYDSNSIPRIWNKKGDIRTITKDARSASLKILSAMAAIRLSEKPDNIEKVLFSSLMDGTKPSINPLASSTWEEVSSKDTLIPPKKCKERWVQFVGETEYIVNQASSLHVKVAKARCEEIATNKFNQLIKSEGWLALEEAAKIHPVSGFGIRFNSILDIYISHYDREVADFDEGIRNSQRQLLKSKALNYAQDVYKTTLPHLCSKALGSFKLGLKQSLKKGGQLFDSSVRTCIQFSMNEFDQGCADAPLQLANGYISSIREKLRADMDGHASSVSSAKWSELSAHYKEQVYASLTKEIGPCVTNGGKDVWASIRNLVIRRGEDGISKLSTAMVDFGFVLDKYKVSRIEADIRDWTRYSVVKIVRDEAANVSIRMKQRFSTDFTYDSNSNTRRWTKNKQIRSVTKAARSAALMLLSDMAVIRLDKKPNNVEEVLFSCLLDGVGNSTNALASRAWEGVSSEDTIFTPAECKNLWEKFLEDTASLVRDATSDMSAHKWSRNFMIARVVLYLSALAASGGSTAGFIG